MIDLVYDYMKRKEKTLYLPIECRMCGKHKSKSEYYTTTKICKECWCEYVKLSKRDKKELLHENRGNKTKSKVSR